MSDSGGMRTKITCGTLTDESKMCVCVWDPFNYGGLQFDGDSAEVRKEKGRKRPERERTARRQSMKFT